MSIASRVASASLVLLAFACVTTEHRSRAARWSYTVEVRADELALEARVPPGEALHLTVAPRAQRFVLGASSDGGPLASDGGAWTLPASASERVVRWRFAARDAARALNDVDLAARRGRAIVGSLSAFLLHDPEFGGDEAFAVDVRPTPGSTFVCASPTRDALGGELRNLEGPVACAFGAIDASSNAVDDSRDWTWDNTITVAPLMALSVSESTELQRWIWNAETGVEAYFDRFPVDHLLILLAPRSHPGVGSGRTLGNGAASIYVTVGTDTTDAEFDRDWVLTHEMIHLALPSLPPQQQWLEEGSATYLEPLLRARAGRLAENEVWRAMFDEYDQGLPEAGDAGLDRTHTWGRTYYGGAIFCLLADVEIRARTQNAKSLRDVFVAVLAEEGNLTHASSIERVIAIGDRATGTSVLAELYARMGNAPEPKELGSLWRDLGVALDGDKVVFDDTAPLAFVRRALILGAR